MKNYVIHFNQLRDREQIFVYLGMVFYIHSFLGHAKVLFLLKKCVTIF